MTNLVQKRASHLTNDCSTFMDFAFSNQHIGSEKHRGNGNIYEKTAKSLDDPKDAALRRHGHKQLMDTANIVQNLLL
ncbi:hypothetical protein PC112_g6281 [Phytophthora cactorum]|nr:hypothetical protein PC112_g6281 [Phytophthora cactorum]